MKTRAGADRTGRGENGDDGAKLRADRGIEIPRRGRRPFVEPALVRHAGLTRITLVSDFGGGGSGTGGGGTFF
jgi:hypothetical protein